jgi:hypothetical protein
MSSRSTNRSGQNHTGTGSRRAPSAGDPLVNHELIGAVRWLDTELRRIVVGVDETRGHAGPFLGKDVTVDLGGASLHDANLDDLTPGMRVRVKARLHDVHGVHLPELIPAHAVYALT